MSSDTSSNFAALNIEDLRERLSVLKTEFATAHPYQHVVIDNFLPENVFQQAMADFDE